MLRARLPGDASAAALVAFLVERGVAVEEVRRERATFEETFLELIHDRHAAGEAIGGQHGSAREAEQRAGNAT
jgi:hypothetical protein